MNEPKCTERYLCIFLTALVMNEVLIQYFVFLHTVSFLSRLCSDSIRIISILLFQVYFLLSASPFTWSYNVSCLFYFTFPYSIAYELPSFLTMPVSNTVWETECINVCKTWVLHTIFKECSSLESKLQNKYMLELDSIV